MQQRFQAVTGALLTEGWGMSKTAPAGTFTPRIGAGKPGSCGLPMPRLEIKFVDATDPSRDLPLGERGEICVKGPNVMKGYWKNPEATAASMTADGFFRTGDIGYMDEDGFVFIVDRTKDMLLVGGFNVYPRIIEEAIYKHPSVEEVSVVGVDPWHRAAIILAIKCSHILLVLYPHVPTIFLFLFPAQMMLFIHPQKIIDWIPEMRCRVM